MALPLILGAVAHQGHRASSRELFNQAKRKLLTMILDGPATLINWAAKKKLLLILS
jgi:hypothetical protein